TPVRCGYGLGLVSRQRDDDARSRRSPTPDGNAPSTLEDHMVCEDRTYEGQRRTRTGFGADAGRQRNRAQKLEKKAAIARGDWTKGKGIAPCRNRTCTL